MTYPFKLKGTAQGKFASYEMLLNEFFENNPNGSEAELNAACLDLAKKCGLRVSDNVKNAYFMRIGGSDE